MTTMSNRDKAGRNAKRLSEWIENTPLAELPLNQFGTVSRQKVCKIVGVPASSVGSNAEIRALLDGLDLRLRLHSPAPSRSHKSFVSEGTREEKCDLLAELAVARRKLSRLSYLEEFATWIPE
ncbi:hypothetical protein SBC1_26960 [Caballeronia sp. SBC1]|uniref:hypothetical protein n=1 Tax=Caballeronia sp. SBC1 TaxID=2705548 RepID=UPI00140BA2AE|nr:hypothetical protein [Caballeronia sp. SBC1]QIN62680.1 hypothetical protein SBC1_26960 [Caballeronia sp. SBC1]